MNYHKKITAIYSRPSVLTGQLAATLTLLEILRARNWQIRCLQLPALNRGAEKRSLAKFNYALQLLLCWLRAPFLCVSRPCFVYLAAGQTKIALIRDLIPFRILTTLTKAKAVISLNGSVFMSWEAESTAFKLFQSLCKTADAVTVLGATQQCKLISLGIPAEKVIILPNTCDLSPVSEEVLSAKFSNNEPFRVLYLSNLIDSKGYPAFLEAMELLAKRISSPVHVTLCGKLLQSDFGEKFRSRKEAAEWIENRINCIRQNPAFTIDWIQGAYGQDKQDLFQQAHLFVFPSLYAVEAQPIVLFEAMASGTAIITSNVGEIPETVQEVGILLEQVTPEEIAKETQSLIESPTRCQTLATSALTIFNTRYSLSKHAEMWMDLFEKIKSL